MITKTDIIGEWQLESGPHEPGENISASFKDDDSLVYTVQQPQGKQLIFLTYKLDGDYLITDQPSDPKEERTLISIKDGKLHLDFEGNVSIFKKLAA